MQRSSRRSSSLISRTSLRELRSRRAQVLGVGGGADPGWQEACATQVLGGGGARPGRWRSKQLGGAGPGRRWRRGSKQLGVGGARPGWRQRRSWVPTGPGDGRRKNGNLFVTDLKLRERFRKIRSTISWRQAFRDGVVLRRYDM